MIFRDNRAQTIQLIKPLQPGGAGVGAVVNQAHWKPEFPEVKVIDDAIKACSELNRKQSPKRRIT